MPFFALARGFLTGKYRPGTEVASARAEGVKQLVGEKGWRVLEPLDEIAAAHRTTVSAVALAWTAAQKGVAVPLASARTRAQLADLLPLRRAGALGGGARAIDRGLERHRMK